MKKIILFLLLLVLITMPVFALDCSLEAGMQYKQIAINNAMVFDDFGKYFVEIGLSQDISLITVYSIYRNEMNSTDTWMFSPRQDYYTVGLAVKWKGFTFDINHECDHIVNNYRQRASGIYGGHNQISIKYSTIKE